MNYDYENNYEKIFAAQPAVQPTPAKPTQGPPLRIHVAIKNRWQHAPRGEASAGVFVDMIFGGEYCILNLVPHNWPGGSRSAYKTAQKAKAEQFRFPAAQTSSRKEQNRVMMLRGGEREGRLKRKPLGGKNINIWRHPICIS